MLSKCFTIAIAALLLLKCTGHPFELEKGGHTRNMSLAPSATIVRAEGYKVLGQSEGESSTFILLGLFPVTRPLNIQYAMSQAVQKIEGGQSLVNINIWHETHYYFPLGKVSVVKVSGDVVSFTQGDTKLFKEKKGKEIEIPGKKPKKKKKKKGSIKIGRLNLFKGNKFYVFL